jgi:hypothetical protein
MLTFIVKSLPSLPGKSLCVSAPWREEFYLAAEQGNHSYLQIIPTSFLFSIKIALRFLSFGDICSKESREFLQRRKR